MMPAMHEGSVFVRRVSQKLRNIWWKRRMATPCSMYALVKRRTVATASISFEGADSLAVGKRAKKLKAADSLVDATFTPDSHLKEAPRLVVVVRKERVIPHLPTDSLNSKSELHRTDC
ncbi:hypothetical protein HOLleu_23615 [Holothuria leucospilota]|uniref:Uncharacterized protein n=1 Tax=Holothuria leucospilota TaxID=206669 RepID=A0A9Q1H4W5_HOLLE|nr:hypothetical protein HOLleu_23615 [Holothuria leucospilota]